jgi:23S rRNA U2552 (ribose-2'-O)-methylase RlmE/FtsJ
MEMGKKHVLDSLRSRDLWGTMGQERQDVYVQKAGKENARALAAYSEMLSVIADLVKRTF